MDHDTDIVNLKLIVRALHQDVSSLDARLQALEAEIRELRERTATPDLHVITSRERHQQLGA
ncbi:MAG: hypothetical protein WEB06_13170 [Actinomycetota bacterium]